MQKEEDTLGFKDVLEKKMWEKKLVMLLHLLMNVYVTCLRPEKKDTLISLLLDLIWAVMN